MVIPIPNSAIDSIVKIFVKRPLIPEYSTPNNLTIYICVKKLKITDTLYEPSEPKMFRIDLFLLIKALAPPIN